MYTLNNVTLFSRREYSGRKIIVLLLLSIDYLSHISHTLRSGILFVVNAKMQNSIGKQRRLDYYHGVTNNF